MRAGPEDSAKNGQLCATTPAVVRPLEGLTSRTGMTPPRQILAGQTFEVVSRCISRLFLLAPSYEVQQTFLYLLGHYAKKHGITLYALVLMANHYHLLGLDKHGNLPHFMRDLRS